MAINLNDLKDRHQTLIVASNPEWAQILNLRSLVRHEFYAHGFLTLPTFESILDWKLRKQRKRTEQHREGNTPELIKELTGVFWRITHNDPNKLLDIRLGILMAIPRVGLGVASAILTLCYPEDFAIIDFRNWKVLFNEEERQFTISEYNYYLKEVRAISQKLDCDVQEVDYLLWKEYEN